MIKPTDLTIELAQFASQTVLVIMSQGLEKHQPDDWLDEDIDMHLLKGARHLNTAQQQLHGYDGNDETNHIANGLVRSVMALYKYTHAQNTKVD